ncbi:MAG: hypothetical protein VB104_02555 [Candidatus Limiplasma sp.]|nr:hypothetical protein [Candidatus Limiplasma sp.]
MQRPNMDSSISGYKKKFCFNRWADYIELQCMFSIDHEISASDFGEVFRDESQNDEDDYTPSGVQETAQITDSVGIFWQDIFNLIASRAHHMPGFYPFIIQDKDSICLANTLTSPYLDCQQLVGQNL